MVNFKVVISDPKSGKSYQREVDSNTVTVFKRKKIGDKIDGKPLGLDGYEFEITGGSDNSGFPMRKDVEGIGRKRILLIEGVGLRKVRKGTRIRKTVCGNTISLNTAQINIKILKYGKEKLGPDEGSEAAKKTEEGKEDKKEEKTEEKAEKKEKTEENKEEKHEKPKKEKAEKKEHKEEKEDKKEE